ncbi:MAG: tRNA (N(6)-L-threonylcarbamoyladenosine(37)-C(2))-methylthiotransferase MtaB [Candidatus Goldbacteria bacterium]|nr:tRNA (N(6)-L-threonylcarbamoyladenosine(37)-C(2))-methylthiotransferase MtaB [Candidatus Goldiibacteriota bacterium]
MKIALHTYGCKVNSYESEVIRQQIKNSNLEMSDEDADVHIINTCTVTKKIDKEIFRKIKQLKKNGKKVILTGCLVERTDKEAEDIFSFADEIISNDKKFRMDGIIGSKCSNDVILSDFSGKDRAYIKVEDGCDNYCSYCEVPYVRGDVIKSREINDVKKEFINLVNAGFNEIVLTGVNLGFYGKESNGEKNLHKLLLNLSGINNDVRIRMSSIGPKELSDDVINLIAESDGKICPHVHLPLQSGDEKILRLMNRNYSLKECEEKIEKIISKIPLCAITTDVIAGFPGEGEMEFKNTYEFIKNNPFSRLHVFPFSKRPDTAASEMREQVDDETKKHRVNKLLRLGKMKEKEFAEKNSGLIRKVLVEKDRKDGKLSGYTDNYIRVKFDAGYDLTGKLAGVKLMEYKEGFVCGQAT